MQFDFSRFLLDIEQRFRWFRGLSLASRMLFYGSIVCAPAILALRWLTPDLDRGLILLSLLIPFTMAAAAFILGWWKRPSLPNLLMQLDDELDSGARISSLYEARIRRQSSFFCDQLEIRVESISSTNWKRGITLPRRTLGFLSAGVAGILAACIILFIPLSFPQAVPLDLPEQSETSPTQLPLSSTPESSQEDRSPAFDEVSAPLELSEEAAASRADSTPESTQIGSNEDLSLDSILDELSSLSRGQAQVDAPVISNELLDLAEAQEQARQALSDMLQDLQEQMQNNPRPLTQQESRTLQDMASQTGDPAIEEQTNDLVDEPNPDQIGEKLQDLMEQLDPDSADPETSPESNQDKGDGSEQNSPQSTEVSGDEAAAQQFLERTAEQLEEQANAEAEHGGEPQQP
ncbi:hypothetical protein KAR02_02355, partial [Candidatus Bipolaricaulota bacterium]|nr:hypothetical protein [Candidatus Bipolaricaulota bacterium]